MPALVLDLLKYVFLAVLYIFVARAVRAIYMELRPASTPSRATSPSKAPARRSKKPPTKLAVIEGTLKGKTLTLNDELIVGRGEKCHLVLDDNYVSQVHARFFSRGEAYMVEDMGSTNGTYLNRNRLTSPAELQRGDRVKIGKTIMEARK